jgi:hypothetical protein
MANTIDPSILKDLVILAQPLERELLTRLLARAEQSQPYRDGVLWAMHAIHEVRKTLNGEGV